MIVALLLLMISGSEEALRITVREAASAMYAKLHAVPDILLQTRQPDEETVEAMAEAVPDEALRKAMTAEAPSMSLRGVVKLQWHTTTAAEVESVIQGTTGEERLARFNKRYPVGLLLFSAPGARPFVTYQWLTARIDKHGDFHLTTAEIHLVELTRIPQGWKISNERSVTLEP
jgi:hypothetical protein